MTYTLIAAVGLYTGAFVVEVQAVRRRRRQAARPLDPR